MNNILLDVQIGQLPVRIGEVPLQQFAEDIASRLIIRFPSDGSTFGIGSILPTSNEGPFFKSETPDSINGFGQEANFELYAWSSSAGVYKRINLSQIQLRYIVSTTEPAEENYLVWFKVDTNGKLINVLTFDKSTGTWEEVLAQLSTVRGYFESFGVDDKGQVAWGNVTGKPNDIQTATNSGANGSDLEAAFDYQRVWHTGINGEIIYNPSFGGWQTVDGVSGDLKFVSAANLGTTGDFNSGTFTTALGRNPGWVEATDEKGRVIVAADASKNWSTISVLPITAGSTFGTSESDADVEVPNTGWGNEQTTGALPEPTDAGKLITGSGLAENNEDLESLAQSSVTQELTSDPFNIVQPSIARFLLRKV